LILEQLSKGITPDSSEDHKDESDEQDNHLFFVSLLARATLLSSDSPGRMKKIMKPGVWY
jgi:hypothetical protein